MAESNAQLLHTCHACGALIDVEDQEPLALVHCPSCGTGQRVRTVFDHFELQDVLGAGGMGAVYRAYDRNLGRSVALKLLRKEFSANPEFVAQFQREAAITASINHPHVVKVYSSGWDQGLLYIAMELVDKGSLDDLMTLQGRVAEAQVLEVGVQIAQGLNAALQKGLIHRDVKPGNILFAEAHSSKIVDFGLATLQEQAGKTGGDVWGTPYYVAPEKLDTPPVEDFRSDMYSLGATLFHAVAGRPPFEAETASMVALKHLKSQAVSLQAFAPDVSSAAAFVINKTLSKEPEDRYASYEELIQNLEYARTELLKKGAGAAAKRARVVMEDEKQAQVMSWITFGIVAVIVLGGVGAWVMRDSLFGPKEKVDPLIEQQRQAMAEIEALFKDARTILLNGDARHAEDRFRELSERLDVSPGMQHWLVLHEGLAQLLAGREIEARDTFGRLADREVAGRDASERKQSQWFIDVAKVLESHEAVPASVAKDYDKTNYECIALLLFALKDWHLGEFHESSLLLRQFQSATPTAPVQWMADYKNLMAPYLADAAVYRSVADALKTEPGDPAAMREASTAIRAARERLKLGGRLRDFLGEAADKIDRDLARIQSQEQQRMLEAETVEAPKLAEAMQKCVAAIAQFRFAEAKAAAEAPSFNSAKYQAKQRLLVERMDALVKFKAQLIQDLITLGYTGPVNRRSGAAVPQGTLRATDTQLELRTPYGVLPIPWTDVTPDSVIGIARSFIRPDMPSEAAAVRQWNLGMYALAMGRRDMGRELLQAAALARPAYQPTLTELLQGDAQ